MSVERRFFSAENLDRAVLEAAAHFGVEPERLRYEQVDKRSGFTKRRRVVIRVDPSRLRREPEAAGRAEPAAPPAAEAVEARPAAPEPIVGPIAEPIVGPIAEPIVEPIAGPPAAAVAPAAAVREQPERRPVPKAEPERPAPPPAEPTARWRRLPRSVEESLRAQPPASRELEEAARQWLDRLLALADLDLAAVVRMGEERLDVGLSGPDAEWLMEDDGEALQALQTLLPRLLDAAAEDSLLCRVDCNGFQELREERLRLRAPRAAAEVRRTGERALLEPMMPADRRIVHVALLHDATVTTESIGRGFFKRVTIRPA
jgi:spoIIIJ-associated protein